MDQIDLGIYGNFDSDSILSRKVAIVSANP